MRRAQFAILIAAFAVALFCFAPSDAFADENESEEKEIDMALATSDEVVVTAKRKNESLQDPAAFVEEIDLKDYEGRFTTASEVLERSTGVRVRDFGGLGQAQSLSIRGADPDQVVVLIDGVRLNSVAGGGADLSLIPLGQIERIEVMRGGSGALQGSGAIGGVVNIVTKKAVKTPVTTLGASYGSFNTFEARASHSRGVGDGAVLASGGYTHSDGDFEYKDDRGTEFNKSDDVFRKRRNNESDVRSALMKGHYDFGNTSISATEIFVNADRGQPGLVTFPSPDAHRKDTQNIANLSAAFTGLSPWLSAGVRADHRYLSTRFEDPSGGQTGAPIVSSVAENDPAGEVRFDASWPKGNVLTVGGGGGAEMLKDDGGIDRTRSVADFYARDQLELWAKRVTLVPAVRFDGVSGVGGQWSPKFGLVFRPWEWINVKGNAGRSFRAPSFTELYANQGMNVGNPDLEPETAFSADAGLQLIFDPYVFFEADYFYQDVENLIEYVLVSGFRYKPFNFASVRVDGAEFSGSVSPHPWVALTGNGTILYAIDKSGLPNRDDLQIPGRPRYMANAGLKLGPKEVQAFGEYNYVGENYVTLAGTKLLPERSLFNAGLVVRPVEGLVLGAQVKNIGDEKVSDIRGLPLPGRSFFGSAEYRF